jgi:hypothetical protein
MKPFREHFSGCLRKGIAVPTSSHQSQLGIIFCNKYQVECKSHVCLKDREDEKS